MIYYTVARHRENIMAKLNVYSVAELTKYAVRTNAMPQMWLAISTNEGSDNNDKKASVGSWDSRCSGALFWCFAQADKRFRGSPYPGHKSWWSSSFHSRLLPGFYSSKFDRAVEQVQR